MRVVRFASLSLSAVFALCCGLAANATPITPTTITIGTSITVSNFGTAPGSPTNYDFNDFGGLFIQPTNLTDYTVSTAGDNQFAGNGNYTFLYAPDGTGVFFTGVATDFSNSSGATEMLATFSSLSDGSFTVYVLDSNTDGVNIGNSSVGLSVNGGAAVVQSVVGFGSNHFSVYDVHNAKATDVFSVYATGAAGDYPSLGGLTFSNVSPVPEPSSLSLGLIGVLTTGASLVRRRFRA